MVVEVIVPQPDGAPLCNAPFSSLHLDPRGDVHACCQNVWHQLGNVSRQSLREIWDGEATRELRRRLTEHDLGLGCEMCAVDVDLGAGGSAFFTQYADLPPVDPSHRWPRQLELALSIACNLQCAMCNGELSSAIRIHREHRPPLPEVYGEPFFEELDEFLPHLERITFLGGEPFLGAEPLRVMERLVDLGLPTRCHVNTNGTQWGRRVRDIVAALRMHVAVSVDGWTTPTVESIRVGVERDALVRNAESMREACRDSGNSFSLTFCLMPANAGELVDVLRWGDRLDCDVFVNTVTNPPGMSLHHLSDERLAEVTTMLSGQDAAARRVLGRNAAVWERSMGYVASLGRRTRLGGPEGGGGGALEQARRWAEEWGGAQPVTMAADEALIIREIGPDASDVFGVDLRHLVGSPTITFMQTLGPCFGTLQDSSMHVRSGGIEQRTFRFSDGARVVELMATMAPVGTGERWFVALREAEAVAVAPPVRRAR